jgi:probable rRNA maturation factor
MESFLASVGLETASRGIVSLSFVEDDKMLALNALYREIDEPTDVLSFPLWEEEGRFCPPEEWSDPPLGDVVVSPAFVRASADGEGLDYAGEIVLMIVHGTLHLVGFDHDTDERENEMRRAQESLRSRFFAVGAAE